MVDLLFEPVRIVTTKHPKTNRYDFVQHKLVKVTITQTICDDCECDCGVEDEEEEVDYVWAIIDKKRGQHDPIGYIHDLDQVEKIVALLNKSTP